MRQKEPPGLLDKETDKTNCLVNSQLTPLAHARRVINYRMTTCTTVSAMERVRKKRKLDHAKAEIAEGFQEVLAKAFGSLESPGSQQSSSSPAVRGTRGW